MVTFEELGIDRLYVDEAHYYKNAFLYTKMRNVAGIAQNEAQKSADMFNKCQYLDEITGRERHYICNGHTGQQQHDGALYHDAVSPVRHVAAERADPFRQLGFNLW